MNHDRILAGNALRDWKSLQSARRRWAAENSRIADDYARKAGLL